MVGVRKAIQDAMDGDTAEKWLQQISAYGREFKKWESRVDKILKRYRDDERRNQESSKFNVLWSNVQTLVPATFSRLPQPDVSRRFRDNDPVGRVASLILERALDFEIQHYADYRDTMKQSVYDRFLGGRGTAWARYEPHIRAVQMDEPEDGLAVTEDVDEPMEELDYECAPVDYVHWKDFGHTVARTWEEVTAVWRRVYMLRTALIERFGEELGKKIPLDATPDELKKGLKSADSPHSHALIYEIWDKESKKALWLSKSLGEIVDEKDDPLELESFFPCPKPLFATITNDSLVPVPDFSLYQDQARSLDILCDRIDGLIRALQVKGVYNAEYKSLARLFTEGENNSLLPVKDWAAFSEKQGLRGAIDLVDIAPIAAALREAYAAMEQLKAQVYEITGISDIIRGQTSASETATAQHIKGQYASLRLGSMREDVSRYATELLQFKAQIMCKKFDPQTLVQISAVDQLSPADQQVVPRALQLLSQNPLRSFRIEVAADTLVQIDENTEKQNRIEFLTAVGSYLEKGAAVGAQAPQLIPLIMELLKFGVAGFKVGKQIEGTIDQALDKLKSDSMAPKPPPPPDPKVVAAQASAQADIEQTKTERAIAPVKAQAEMMKAKAGVVKAQTDLQTAQVQAMTPMPPGRQ